MIWAIITIFTPVIAFWLYVFGGHALVVNVFLIMVTTGILIAAGRNVKYGTAVIAGATFFVFFVGLGLLFSYVAFGEPIRELIVLNRFGGGGRLLVNMGYGSALFVVARTLYEVIRVKIKSKVGLQEPVNGMRSELVLCPVKNFIK